ncbi:hypothetical protein [Romboutsia sp.]|uniref:hypothetical protein n=1 Tax=Romboutsia sp. TaxID=1965302 RepID=UPI002B726238|nr:hypothetical protein [Romboutsia sp.]HSQ87987.1 hypothetical protein [Romboutsia sp.]
MTSNQLRYLLQHIDNKIEYHKAQAQDHFDSICDITHRHNQADIQIILESNISLQVLVDLRKQVEMCSRVPEPTYEPKAIQDAENIKLIKDLDL